jgi:hypothetical protein
MIFCRTGLIVLTCLYYIFPLNFVLVCIWGLVSIVFPSYPWTRRHPYGCEWHPWLWTTPLEMHPSHSLSALYPSLLHALRVHSGSGSFRSRIEFDRLSVMFMEVWFDSLLSPTLCIVLLSSSDAFCSLVTPNANSWSWLSVARLSIRFRSSFDCRLFTHSGYSLTHN